MIAGAYIPDCVEFLSAVDKEALQKLVHELETLRQFGVHVSGVLCGEVVRLVAPKRDRRRSKVKKVVETKKSK